MVRTLTQLLGTGALVIAASSLHFGCSASPHTGGDAGTNDAAASPASISEGDDALATAILLEEEAAQRRTPPPRMHGKRFTTSAPAADGSIRRVDICIVEGNAETRVNGRLVPPDRVLVHRRGSVDILAKDGSTELSFNLPRGMTSVANSTGR